MKAIETLRRAQRATARSLGVFLRDVGHGLLEISHNTLALLGLAVVAVLVFAAGRAELRHQVEVHGAGMAAGPPRSARSGDGDVLSVAVAEPAGREPRHRRPTRASCRASRPPWPSGSPAATRWPPSPSAPGAGSLADRPARRLDPTLILAIMAVESSFNPFAQSPVGAQGLMQVMTRVHDDKYEAFGGTHAAFDPVSNLRVGVQVLKECIARAGSLQEGLRYYVGAALLDSDGGYAGRCWASRPPAPWPTAEGAGQCPTTPPAPAPERGARKRRRPPRRPRAFARCRRRAGGAAALSAIGAAPRPATLRSLARLAIGGCRPPRWTTTGKREPARPAVRGRLPAVRLGSPRPRMRRRAGSRRPFIPKRTAMFDRSTSTIANVDPEIWAAIQAENRRQEEHIELIASENYTSPAVMAAQGSQLTNKYAEGYPGKRYYGGCEYVDVVEQLAIDRLKQLFGAGFANVQPNSGSQANQAVFFGLLQPGDTIMGMSLAEGGHLTHGMALNMSGKWFKVVSYGLDANEAIDYDAMERLAHEHKPKLIIAGASAYSLRIDFERFAAWPRPWARSSWSTWRTTPA
jgi:hypothetical protein